MIYLDVDAVEFSDKHDIPIKEVICENCRKPFYRNLPVVTRDSWGLVSPEHGCQWQSGAFVDKGTWSQIFPEGRE